MAFYGDPEKAHTKESALGYYTDTSNLDMVGKVLEEIGGYTATQKHQYYGSSGFCVERGFRT